MGEAAHISGQHSGSARFNQKMTDEERSNINNGIWLCSICHALVDRDPQKYSIETIVKWKSDHEAKVGKSIIKFSTSNIFQEFPVEVVIESNNGKSDVIFIEKQSQKQTFFGTFSEVYESHYHNAEYHNGNLYLIHRTGGDNGYEVYKEWTDELWKYDINRKGVRMFARRGIDFRVSEDESLIAVEGEGEKGSNESIFIINHKGDVLKIINPSDQDLSYRLLKWHLHTIWFADGIGPGIHNLFELDVDTMVLNCYEAPDAMCRDFSLEPSTKRIAYSDFPAIYDVDSANEFIASGTRVHLFVYDLLSKEKRMITDSSAEAFDPAWVSSGRLEYFDPALKRKTEIET